MSFVLRGLEREEHRQLTNDDNSELLHCDDLHLRARNAFFCPSHIISYLLEMFKKSFAE